MEFFEDIKKNIEVYAGQAKEGIADAKDKFEQARDTICEAKSHCEKGIVDTYEYLVGPGQNYIIVGLAVSIIVMLALKTILVLFFVNNKKEESTMEKIAEEAKKSFKYIGEQAKGSSSMVKEETEKIAEEAKQSLEDIGKQIQDASSMVKEGAEKIAAGAKQSLEYIGLQSQDLKEVSDKVKGEVENALNVMNQEYEVNKYYICDILGVIIVSLMISLGVYIFVTTNM